MKSYTFTMPNVINLYIAKAISDEAKLYSSSIDISNGTTSVNAKTLLSMMTLDITPNAKLTLTANGEDETLAIEELIKIFSSLKTMCV